jgi:hypothetical protein
MATPFSRAVKVFFNPTTFFTFLLGSVFLSVAGNAAYGLFTNWLGTASRPVAGILLGSLLGLGLAIWVLGRVLGREAATPPAFRGIRALPHRGLILLVSRLEVCRKAIRHHGASLEQCWLICSVQTLEMAQELRHEFLKVCPAEPIIVNDVNDPLEFCNAVEKIYTSLPRGWAPDQLIGDYTGMTAHGSVGMALACLRGSRPLQYTPGTYDAQLKAVAPLDPIQIVLDPEAMRLLPAAAKQSP